MTTQVLLNQRSTNTGKLACVSTCCVSLVRRSVIMALMCQGSVLFESVELSFLVDFRHYFAAELTALALMQDQGLLTLDDSGLHVTALGWFFCARHRHGV